MKYLIVVLLFALGCSAEELPRSSPANAGGGAGTLATGGGAGACSCVGEQGPEGPAGKDGLPGKDGTPGKDGAPGPQGLQGLKGDPGAKGDPGMQGYPGSPGATGATGAAGPAGPAGKDGFLSPAKLYVVTANGIIQNNATLVEAVCNPGDFVVSGGCWSNPATIRNFGPEPANQQQWATPYNGAAWYCQTNGISNITATAVCVKP